MVATVLAAIAAELERIEEDCVHSGKAHFNANTRWTRIHNFFGGLSVVLSALAAATYFKQFPDVASLMAAAVAVLTGLLTFLKPSERAAKHKGSGDQFLALRNDARVYRTVTLQMVADPQVAHDAMTNFTKRRNELNQASPQFSRGDFKKARSGIDAGEATHRVDQGAPQ